jgi:hypothetical protein
MCEVGYVKYIMLRQTKNKGPQLVVPLLGGSFVFLEDGSSQ